MTKVLFLIHRDTDGTEDLFAFFPEEMTYNNLLLCYSHVGQHSACSDVYADESREATPREYASLKIELEGLGYRLKILNQSAPTNMHILTIKYIGPGNVQNSRVKIISERFKQSVTFEFDGNNGNTLEQAEAWLIRKGHNVIGRGVGKGHYYVVCGHVDNKFKPLK